MLKSQKTQFILSFIHILLRFYNPFELNLCLISASGPAHLFDSWENQVLFALTYNLPWNLSMESLWTRISLFSDPGKLSPSPYSKTFFLFRTSNFRWLNNATPVLPTITIHPTSVCCFFFFGGGGLYFSIFKVSMSTKTNISIFFYFCNSITYDLFKL